MAQGLGFCWARRTTGAGAGGRPWELVERRGPEPIRPELRRRCGGVEPEHPWRSAGHRENERVFERQRETEGKRNKQGHGLVLVAGSRSSSCWRKEAREVLGCWIERGDWLEDENKEGDATRSGWAALKARWLVGEGSRGTG